MPVKTTRLRHTNSMLREKELVSTEIGRNVNKMEHEQDELSNYESDDEETVHVLSVKDDDDDNGYWVTALLENEAVWMQVDTGTCVSMVSEAVYKEKLKHLALRETKLKLRTYTGEPVPVLGVVDVTVEHNEQKKNLHLYIIQGNRRSLPGCRWIKKIGLNWLEVFVVMDRDTSPLQVILKKHPKVFDGELGSMKDMVVKRIKPGTTPKCLKAIPVPYAIKPNIGAELDKLVKSGVLEPVSTSEWATPIVLVIKKDGAPRICGNFKVTANPVLTVEPYPLTLIDDPFQVWLEDRSS